MFNQVSAFLTQNNLLDSNQSGFRSGYSTETALLSVVEALRLARADAKSSILNLLDLSAAFDTINHQILLSTLLVKGISGTALQWFKSCLSNRYLTSPRYLEGPKAWNTLHDFCLDFPLILQSEQVDASWGKSEPVCRLQLTDSTENRVVYDGHSLQFFSFRLWFHPVGGYQTCLIFSADFRTYCFHLSCVS